MNLSSQEKIGFLIAEIKDLLQKRAVSTVLLHDRQKEIYSVSKWEMQKLPVFRVQIDKSMVTNQSAS